MDFQDPWWRCQCKPKYLKITEQNVKESRFWFLFCFVLTLTTASKWWPWKPGYNREFCSCESGRMYPHEEMHARLALSLPHQPHPTHKVSYTHSWITLSWYQILDMSTLPSPLTRLVFPGLLWWGRATATRLSAAYEGNDRHLNISLDTEEKQG